MIIRGLMTNSADEINVKSCYLGGLDQVNGAYRPIKINVCMRFSKHIRSGTDSYQRRLECMNN